MTTYWKGKRVFVTGGSSGIGLALCEELARRGAHVWTCALDRAELDAALERIWQAETPPGQRLGSEVLDVSDAIAVARAAPRIIEALGGIDLVVNNAGVACVHRLFDTPPFEYRRMMEINYFGTVWVTRAFAPAMIAQRSGRIACVSSALGVMGLYGYGAYAASKFAVVGFCECLHQDLLEYDVGVSLILPADVDTPQLRANLKDKPPETAALAGTADVLSAESVADEILAGLERGSFVIAPGTTNRWIQRLNHAAPGLVQAYIDERLKQYWRHHPAR